MDDAGRPSTAGDQWVRTRRAASQIARLLGRYAADVAAATRHRDLATLGAIWVLIATGSLAAFPGIAVDGAWVVMTSLVAVVLLHAAQTEATPSGLVPGAVAVASVVLLPLGGLTLAWPATLGLLWSCGFTSDGRDVSAENGAAADAEQGESTTISARERDEDGERIEGRIRSDVDGKGTVHVSFHPPLDAAPEVELEILTDGFEASVDEATAFGLRVTTRGCGRADFFAFAAATAVEDCTGVSDERGRVSAMRDEAA